MRRTWTTPTATQSSRNRRTSSGASPRSRGPTIGGVNARSHRAPCIAVMTMALLAVACGSGAGHSSTSHTQTRAARRAPAPVPPANPAPPTPDLGQGTVPTPAPTGAPAAANAVSVIRAWSDALRHGDVQSAARYFALPSVMVNGSDGAGEALVITIGDRAPGRGRQCLATLRRAAHYNRPAWPVRERAVPPDRTSGAGRHGLRRWSGHHRAYELRDRARADRGVAPGPGRSGR